MEYLLYLVPGNRSVQHSKIPTALFGSKTRQLMSDLSCFPANKSLFCFPLRKKQKKPKHKYFYCYLVLGTGISVKVYSFTFLTGLLSILLTFGSGISAKHKRIITHYFTLLQADLHQDLYQGRQHSLEGVAHFDSENFQRLFGPKN